MLQHITVSSAAGNGGRMPLTMSSREIADLTGKRHDNVMRDTRSMLVELYGEGGFLSFEDTHRNEQNGQPYPIYQLPKRECLVLVSGYSVELRVKIIDRWMELEAAPKFDPITLLNDNGWLRGTLLTYTEKVSALEGKVAELQPAADVLDRISRSDEVYGFRQTSQILQQAERKFAVWLQGQRWCFRQNGSRVLMAYADKRPHLMRHAIEPYTKADGTEATKEVLKFTTAGIVKLAKLLNVMPDFSEAPQ